MGFSIWNLFKAGLLTTNAMLILNRRRFLAKYGLHDVNAMGCNPNENPMKVQLIGLLQAVQYIKLPVIVLNVLMILFELILGGAS